MRSYNGYRVFVIAVLLIIFFALLITNLARCSQGRRMTTQLYAGRGDKWLAAYTIIKTNSMYYQTLYIQYLLNSKTPIEELDDIHQIEYSLRSDVEIISSSAPQALEDRAGITIVNLADPSSVKLVSADEVLITIKWSRHEETITLSKLE